MGYQHPEYVAYAHKLSDRFFNDYKTKHQLVQVSSGGGMKYSVDLVGCSYVGYRKVELSEARRLFVEGVESFCSIFNHDPIIRPYLQNFPFGHNNIELTLSFEDPVSGQRFSPPYISAVFCVHDIIFYRQYDWKTDSFIKYYPRLCKNFRKKTIFST